MLPRVFLALLLCYAASANAQLFQLQPDSEIVRPGPGVKPPRIRKKKEPSYSSEARHMFVQGDVVLGSVIDEQGLPTDISIISPLGFGLDEKAQQAVAAWRFWPAQKNGRPVKFEATIVVSFRLSGMYFDKKPEIQRREFNILIARLRKQSDQKIDGPTLAKLEDLARRHFAPAEYALGASKLNGKALAKDEAEGLRLIQLSAKGDYGPALYLLGQLSCRGELLPRDFAGGLQMMRDAAVLGSDQAQQDLGYRYAAGDGVVKDPERSRRYFRLCASSGVMDCQLRLAAALTGSNNENDQLQGLAWLAVAADAGSSHARMLFDHGFSRLPDDRKKWVLRLKEQMESRKRL